MPEHRRIFLYSIAISVLMLANASFSVRAQEATSGWQTLSPEGEEFAILMPKDPKFQESRGTLPSRHDSEYTLVFVRERPWSSPGRSVLSSVASKPLAWEPTISCGSTPC